MKLLKDQTYEALQSRAEQADSLLAELQEVRRQLADKEKSIQIDGQTVVVTPGPSSIRDLPQNAFLSIQKTLNVVTPEYPFEVIPVIRALAKVNPDISQVVNDMTRLANTGHKIRFDPSVGPDQIDKMRQTITDSSKGWHVGAAGMGGIVNKMFRQLFIGGALSNEWIPNLKLDDIEELRFINPETIRFVLEKNTKGYQPYQRPRNKPIVGDITKELRKLNTNQYRYYALNGDTDLPYGIPPFMAALDPLNTQKKMLDNIKFVIECLGAMGYAEARMAKPSKLAGETDDQYVSRLTGLLTTLKDRIKGGMRDGVMVGFIDDHEFEFQATSKDAKGVSEIFNMNENLIASAVGFDPIFMGRPGATESLVTVMFTKMLAQLKNVQDIVKENLEFGYRLLLTLKGFSFKSLSVEFNRSTITDDLKYQQAQEILIRNLVVKYHYGIISLEQFADELGSLAPDQKEPRIDINQTDPTTGEVKKQNREKAKDKSAKKGRDKKNPQGTVKRQKNSNEPRIGIKKQGRVINIA